LNYTAPIIVTGAIWIGASFFLTMYNYSRLDADDPSKFGGIGGLLVGSATALGGAAIIIYPNTAVQLTGVACMTTGLVSVYYGVKNLAAVHRKFIEAEEQGLVFEPILIDDGSGRPGPGLQVSWTF